jgi:hypothetical protein
MELKWKPANKRQQEQFWCGDKALVAKVRGATLCDWNGEVKLDCEIVVTGETVIVHYESASQEFSYSDYVFHFEKAVKGLAVGQTDIEDIFKMRLSGQTLVDAGYKESY